MVTTILWLGTIAGLVAGLVHAAHILASQSSLPGSNSTLMAVYRAGWAVVLWTLLGSYLLVAWIVGAVLRAVLGRKSGQGQPT